MAKAKSPLGAMPVFRPKDYGMDEMFKGRNALSLFFAHIPVVSKHHLPCLFGFRLGRSFRDAIVKERYIVEVVDPRYGLLLFKAGFVHAGEGALFSYMDMGWHPLAGPIILKTLFREGDNLLLGTNFIAWASREPGVDSNTLPGHWLLERGGHGGGMLLRKGRDGVEEWVFVMIYEGQHFSEQVASLFRDLQGILEARFKNGGEVPRVRLMMTHAGAWVKPGRKEVRRQFYHLHEAFAHGVTIKDSTTNNQTALGVVDLAFGVVSGINNVNPLHWKLWEDEDDGPNSISPTPPTKAILGASRTTRKHTSPRDKMEKIVDLHLKRNQTNRTNNEMALEPPKTPQIQRLFDD